MNEAPKRSHVLAALLAVYLIWGSTYYAIKLALPDYPPFLLTGTRMLIAGGLLLAWLAWKKHRCRSRASGGRWSSSPR
jgi:drug/metabolite transporter (DMT)-like permease